MEMEMEMKNGNRVLERELEMATWRKNKSGT